MTCYWIIDILGCGSKLPSKKVWQNHLNLHNKIWFSLGPFLKHPKIYALDKKHIAIFDTEETWKLKMVVILALNHLKSFHTSLSRQFHVCWLSVWLFQRVEVNATTYTVKNEFENKLDFAEKLINTWYEYPIWLRSKLLLQVQLFMIFKTLSAK